jgi:hypothetical protein
LDFLVKGFLKKIYVSNELEYNFFVNAKNVLQVLQKGLTNMGVILSLSKVLKSTSYLPMTL